jgi:hypothetical protein
MKITHQLNFIKESHPDLFKLVEKTGVNYKVTEFNSFNHVIFQITDDHPYWSEVVKWVGKQGIIYGHDTSFSDDEILGADWVRLTNIYGRDYPQPEETWVTNPNNLEDFCHTCGTFRQTLPFHIKKEPKLGKNHFMSLEWTAGIVFAIPAVVELLISNGISGFETWKAIIHKTGQPAQSIQQLYISNETSPGLIDSSEIKKTICQECGKIKYGYHRKGKMKFKKEALPESLDIVQTQEWFGAGQGHFAYKELIVSKRFAHLIIKNKWKGLEMKVIEVV